MAHLGRIARWSSWVPEGLRVDRALRIVWKAAPSWTLAAWLLVVVQAATPLATLFLFKLMIDRVTEQGAVPVQPGAFEGLAVLVGLALLVALLSSLCSALLSYVTVVQGSLVSDHMQAVVQEKSVDLDLAYYENSQHYDKLHRAQAEAPKRPARIIRGLTELARASLMLLGAFAVLFAFNWAVVLVVFVAAVPSLLQRLRQAEAVYQLHRDRTENERLAEYLNRVITTVRDAKEVRVFGFGPRLIERYRALRQQIREAVRLLSAQGARRQFATESAAVLAGYSTLAVILYAAVQQTITLGELVMYFGAFQVAIGALRSSLSGLAEVYENNLFLSALDELLRVPVRIQDPADPAPFPDPWRKGIDVQDLSFAYPDTDRLVLDGISLSIRPGEVVALVGQNGSGKTTLTKLLSRLYDPTAGRICVDGRDARQYRVADLHRSIGVIYQDFGRYHLSARENIALARTDLAALDPAVEDAAKWAGIHDRLVALPKGYDTVLSRTLTDGAELSVGQWQKLALARALLRDAQLILLDEPTSALDPAAEYEFFDRFRAMLHGRAALIISHRFSTVRLADRIAVLQDGRLVEEGSHEALLALDGLYAALFRKQASFYAGGNDLARRTSGKTQQPSAGALS